MANDVQTVIVGGGFAGINTAYHLSKAGIESLVIEAGKVAEGNDQFPAGTTSPMKPDFTKLITHAFDSNHDNFVRMHGLDRARKFLELTYKGTELIRNLIKNYRPEVIRELGSVLVAEDSEQFANLQEEHRKYGRLGFGEDYSFMSKSQLNGLLGLETHFFGGLYVPIGAIVNQREYIKMVLGLSNPHVEICERTKVLDVEESSEGVKVVTESSGDITADNVIIATNSFYEDENLRGLAEPRFTFMRCYNEVGENTPSCWTFEKQYHYMTRQDNVLVVGGLDIPTDRKNHFRIDETEPMQELQAWAQQRFSSAKPSNLVCTHFGIYAKTKDELPIVGKFDNKSRISYIVGCNAIGHTTYMVASELMPALIGYKDFTEEQRTFAEFLSPQRATLRKV